MRLAVLALVLLPATLAAAETGAVRGRVRVTTGGKPRADAAGILVYAVGFEEPPPPDVPEMWQRGRQFQPPLLAITAGQSVSFPNGDPFFHNVFSMSPARRFDLGQFQKGEAKAKLFPATGIVEVYCNIHPDMAATIVVLPNRRHALTAGDGSFTLEGLPAGKVTLFGFDRLAGQPARVEVVVQPGQTTDGVKLDIDESQPARAPHPNKYGETYGS